MTALARHLSTLNPRHSDHADYTKHESITMTINHDKIQKNETGLYTWVVLLCINGNSGFGSFSCVMNYVPVIGQTVEFSGLNPKLIGKQSGNISGTVIGINHVAQMVNIFPPQMSGADGCGFSGTDEGMSSSEFSGNYYAVFRQELQIKIEYR